jgi:hypothetical protein
MCAPVRLHALAATLLAGALAACASYADVRFEPVVQDVELRGEAGDLQARIVVAWREIAEPDEGPELRLRVRVENPGTVPFTLVPAEFRLLDAALVPFGPARIADLPVSVAPGSAETFDLAFPAGAVPLGERDLSAIHLGAELQAQRWSWSTNFQRDVYAYHDHPGHSPWSFHFGAAWYVD